MTSTPWIRFFASDWLAGTRGMTAAETGVYITLIALMYEKGGSIENNPARLSRLCGASNSMFKKTLAVLIEEGKIVEEDGYLTNNRAVEELSYSINQSDVAREKANRRWRKNSNKNNDHGDAAALQQQCTGNAEIDANQNQNQITTEGKPSVVTPPSDAPTPTSEKPSSPKSKKGTRIPDDWTPSMEDRQYAVSKGVPADMVDEAAEEFRNYWKSAAGAKGVKLDWRATWQNRCILVGRQIAEREARNIRFPPKPPEKPRNRGGFATILQENMDELLRDFHDEQPPHHPDRDWQSEPEIIPPGGSDTRGFAAGGPDLFRDENRADGLSNVFDFRQARAYG